jgi:hypothetical protein
MYLVNSAMGGEYGPLEEEAYSKETPYSGPTPVRDEIEAGGQTYTPLNRDWAAQNPDYEDWKSTQAMLERIRAERYGR